MSELRAQLLDGLGDDAELEAQWRRHAEAQGNAFISPDWYRAWLAAYPGSGRPAIAAVRDAAGALRGVLPLGVSREGLASRWSFGGANLGDLFAPACAPGDEEAVATAAAAALGRARLIVLDNVDASARWWGALAAYVQGSPLAITAYKQAVLPRIELGGAGWKAYLAGRSRNMRSQIGRKTRGLERDHGLAIRLAGADSLDDDLGVFFRLHEARWGERGGSGALTPRAREFHRDFARRALEQGWLRLWTLELDGEPAASWYGWRLGESYCYYQAGFDPRRAKLSAGFVLLAHTIRAAAEEGCESYELLLGDEAYKARFATGERRVQKVVLTGRAHPMRPAVAAEAALWRLSRRLPEQTAERGRRAYRVLGRVLPTARRR